MRVQEIDKADIPSLREDEETMMQRGDPVKFLHAFARIARRHDRYKIGFDRQTLHWVARMWNEAAVVSLMADDIRHEAERYNRLLKDLETGGYVRLEPQRFVICRPLPARW